MIYALVFLAGGMFGCTLSILVMALCHMAHDADADEEEDQKRIAQLGKHKHS
ncbi:hypothetical protein [Sodalis praecaptivus]|uniref:hypothetical protein n=1 Tax=Sodalis TaxID=84565 RepID=UPI0004B1389B|nr:hypothetical protein [Sodalis praecaptivus]